jgi:hypothetical protein
MAILPQLPIQRLHPQTQTRKTLRPHAGSRLRLFGSILTGLRAPPYRAMLKGLKPRLVGFLAGAVTIADPALFARVRAATDVFPSRRTMLLKASPCRVPLGRGRRRRFCSLRARPPRCGHLPFPPALHPEPGSAPGLSVTTTTAKIAIKLDKSRRQQMSAPASIDA